MDGKDVEKERMERAEVDRINTEHLSDEAKRAYYTEKYGTPEEKKAYNDKQEKLRAQERVERGREERAEIDYINTKHLSDEAKRAYYVENYGTPEEKKAYHDKQEKLNAQKEAEKRLEIEKHQTISKAKNEERTMISAPLNELLSNGLPSDYESLKTTLRSVMTTEPGALTYDDVTVVMRDFLNDSLGKTLQTLEANKDMYAVGDTAKVSQSVSDYLRIVSALQDIGYPHLNMRKETVYYLNNDTDHDLGFSAISQFLKHNGNGIEIELPRGYDKEYPQSYVSAYSIMSSMMQDIDNGKRDDTRWELLGYKSPEELHKDLADKSIEERQGEAKSGIRSVKAYMDYEDRANKYGVKINMPSEMRAKIDELRRKRRQYYNTRPNRKSNFRSKIRRF